jgi:sugar lactone lactonase YvrE
MLENPMGIWANPSGKLYVADNDLWLYTLKDRIVQYDLSSGAMLGWIGRIGVVPTGGAAGCSTAPVGNFTPGWCTGGESLTTAIGTGGLGFPYGITGGDGALYVSDHANDRIDKYDATTGALSGWVGSVGTTTPTGGTLGCSTAAANTFTPGWCIGGTSAAGASDGMMNAPWGITLDSQNEIIYLADYGNNRIGKYNATTGDFSGWIGAVGVTPTGGAVGCSAAAPGSFTPGWCTGGNAQSGSGDGMLFGPTGIYVDHANDALYVSDADNHRVSKYVASTGAFVGWIGRVGVTPTGGAAGCTSAPPNGFTPGWCTGGSSTFADSATAALGGFSTPQGLVIDSSGSLYVADSQLNRINKFNATSGAFIGWRGNVLSTPSGGATGCTTTVVNAITPGWCIGGLSSEGFQLGMFEGPIGLTMDSNGYLYVSEANNNDALNDRAQANARVTRILDP